MKLLLDTTALIRWQAGTLRPPAVRTVERAEVVAVSPVSAWEIAIKRALGDFAGIRRFGSILMPMDETMGMAAVDFCGRTAAVVDTKVRTRLVGDLQAELVYDFFEGFARGARANVHARVLYGRSNHHKIEALFKAFSRALRAACWRDRRMARLLPSTKGVL